MNGPELFSPDEAGGSGIEGLSEDAKQRFAAAARAMKQQKKDERRAKKRDQQVARAIIKFLNDTTQTRFLILISKLVARNCPSIFILGLLSLIDEECLKVVREYFSDFQEPDAEEMVGQSVTLTKEGGLNEQMNKDMIEWITRLQMILVHDAQRILDSLLIVPSGENATGPHLDGSVLQITIFILQEYFKLHQRDLPYEKAQPLTASILQTVFEPFLHLAQKQQLASGEGKKENEDDEDDED